MKKFVAFLCSLLVVSTALTVFEYSQSSSIESKYYDSVGNILSTEKYKSLPLQEQALKRKDTVFIFGSSELAKLHNPFRPIKFFENKKDGFQINSIGAAGYKSIMHAMNFGAIADKLKGHKLVFVISPQWFDRTGTGITTFHANYSEDMFYAFMFNNNIKAAYKRQMAKYVLRIVDCKYRKNLPVSKKGGLRPTTDNIKKLSQFYKAMRQKNLKDKNAQLAPPKDPNGDDLNLIRIYCNLYLGNNVLDKAKFALMKPYFYARYKALNIKSEMNSIVLLDTDKTQKNKKKHIAPKKTSFNWTALLKKAEERGNKVANNNPFGMDNGIYRRNLKGNIKYFKGIYKNITYTNSPEYGDFKLLLDICKSNGIKPLFVNVPVNGPWYDYCGFDRGRRQKYYNKIRKIIKAYNFDLADFSDHEYDKYFLKDASHLGYKGWVYVNEAIDKYYHNKF